MVPEEKPSVSTSKAASAAKDSSPERICVLVAGSHRSGTSMLAGILQRLGCTAAQNLLTANFANERGYYESAPIARLNDRILMSAGSLWSDWQPVNPGWFSSVVAEDFRDQALALVDEEFGDTRLFVLKDPRICRLMPFWRTVLEAKGIDLRVLHIHRNPLEVAASLKSRDGFNLGYGQLLWLRNTLEAEVHSRDLPRYFTSYVEVMDNWAKVMEAAAADLGLNWPRMSSRVIADVQDFVSPDLKHFRIAASQVFESPLVPDWTRGTFEIFERWTQKQLAQDDVRRLDEIRGQFDQSGMAFAENLDELAEVKQALKNERTALEQRRAEADHWANRVSALTIDLERAIRALSSAQAETGHWVKRVETLEGELAELRFDHQAEIHQLQQRLEQAREEGRAAKERLGALRRQADAEMASHAESLRNKEAQAEALRRQSVADTQELLMGLDHARTQMEALLFEKEQVLASRSWRITAPLRRLRGVFRR